MQYNLQKFAMIMEQLGKVFKQSGAELSDASEVINSETDMKIFIEHHKSTNMVVNKERFLPYDDNMPVADLSQQALSKSVASAAQETAPSNLVIMQDYMST